MLFYLFPISKLSAQEYFICMLSGKESDPLAKVPIETSADHPQRLLNSQDIQLHLEEKKNEVNSLSLF